MAWPPKDMLSWETWKKVGVIYLLTILNLILNALTVYLLWDMTNLLRAMLGTHHVGAAASAASSGTQQIAVVQAPMGVPINGTG